MLHVVYRGADAPRTGWLEIVCEHMQRRDVCAECVRLEGEVVDSLEKVMRLTQAQLAAVRAKDRKTFNMIGDALETAQSQKARALVTLERHRDGHGGKKLRIRVEKRP